MNITPLDFARRNLAPCSILLLLVLAAGACSDTSPAFNRAHLGRTLAVTVVDIEQAPQLRYRVTGPGEEVRHFRIMPSSEDLELVLVMVKVSNHTATSATLNVDERAAELRDISSGKYPPISVDDRAEEVDAPPNPSDERDVVFVKGPFVLDRDYGVTGLMVFEAPKDTKFREFRWRAVDSLTIEF